MVLLGISFISVTVFRRNFVPKTRFVDEIHFLQGSWGEISSVALTVFGRNFVSFLIQLGMPYTKFRPSSRFVYETGSGDTKGLEDEIP